MIRTSIWDRSNDSSMLVSIVGVPSLENTAPKKLDAATRNRISTEISRVLTRASWNLDGVIFRYARVINSAPNAPQAAPSVGVAQPSRIEPRANPTSRAGGTSPR